MPRTGVGRRYVFGINIESCAACGRAVRIITRVEDPATIENGLSHVGATAVPGLCKLTCDNRSS